MLDVGQHQILFVRHAQLAEAVAVGQIGDEIDLLSRGIAGRDADLLERQHDDRVTGHLVRLDIALEPVGERLVFGLVRFKRRVDCRQRLIGVRREVAGDPVQFLDCQRAGAVLQVQPFLFDLAREFLGANRLQQNLDARLVLIVAPAVLVVDAHDGLDIGHHVLPWQELADYAAQNRRTSHAAADHDAKAHFAAGVVHHGQADVMHGDRGAVFHRAIDRDLEFARQVGELRMEGAPLAQDLGVRTRVDDLVDGDAGKFIGRDITDAIAGGLVGVHFDRRQMLQNVRCLFQINPVELDVLTRREMAVTAVIGACNVGKHAHLLARQQAVWHGDAQHVGVALHV